MALGSYDAVEVDAIVDRVLQAGLTVPHVVRGDNVVACYITDAGREIELAGLSAELAACVGFAPVFPFLNQGL